MITARKTHPINFKKLINFLDSLIVGALLSYIGGLFLLMSFCSPYWIESYDESFSSFKNMGLWEYCFKDFIYPYYQFPRLFNGCHNIFSHVNILSTIMYTKLKLLNFFSGILRYSRMASTRMANGGSNFCDISLHQHLCRIRYHGVRNYSLSLKNSFTI